MSGGFAKGAFQVGVLQAIDAFFGKEAVKYISASSVGVLNAYAFTQGKLDKLEAVWQNLNFTGFRSFANTYLRSSYIPELIADMAKDTEKPVPPHFYATFINVTKKAVEYLDLSKMAAQNFKSYLIASVTL
jgi:predicted acylesterase/phospholipase RssA